MPIVSHRLSPVVEVKSTIPSHSPASSQSILCQAQEVQQLAQEARPAIEQQLIQSSHRLSSVMASNGLSGGQLPAAPLQRLSSGGAPLTHTFPATNTHPHQLSYIIAHCPPTKLPPNSTMQELSAKSVHDFASMPCMIPHSANMLSSLDMYTLTQRVWFENTRSLKTPCRRYERW